MEFFNFNLATLSLILGILAVTAYLVVCYRIKKEPDIKDIFAVFSAGAAIPLGIYLGWLALEIAEGRITYPEFTPIYPLLALGGITILYISCHTLWARVIKPPTTDPP